MAKAGFRFLPGDRAPNFTLPDTSGRLRMFYEETRGLPILLYFHDRSLEAMAGLQQIAGPQAQLPATTHVFVIDNADVAADPVREAGASSRVIRLKDSLGRIGDTYRAAAGIPAGPVLFVLDVNQRLVATRRPAMGIDLAGEARMALAAQASRAPATSHAELAPVLMVPRVLDGETCARLIRVFETEGYEEGAVLSTVGGTAADRINYGSKKRLDQWVKNAGLTRELTGLLGPRLGAEVHRAFHFEGFWLEPFVIVCYDAARGRFLPPASGQSDPRAGHAAICGDDQPQRRLRGRRAPLSRVRAAPLSAAGRRRHPVLVVAAARGGAGRRGTAIRAADLPARRHTSRRRQSTGPGPQPCRARASNGRLMSCR